MEEAPPPLRTRIAAPLAAAALALFSHVLYSPLGFNATDEGWMLAGSRRLLDGEVPHRDFISLRPAGSSLLHVPEVAFGGDHVILLSRLAAWIQYGVIAWPGFDTR